MAEKSILAQAAELKAGEGDNPDIPEAGPLHYLERGIVQGASGLADLPPNLYNLGKAAIGSSPFPEWAHLATGKPKTDYMPEAGDANLVRQFILKNKQADFLPDGHVLGSQVRPGSYTGGDFGASVIEGAGASLGQGPLGLVKEAPIDMAKALMLNQGKNAVVGGIAGGGSQIGASSSDNSPYGALLGGVLAGTVVPSSFLRLGGVTWGGIRAAKNTYNDLKAAKLAQQTADKIKPSFSEYVNSTVRGAAAGTPNAAENLTTGLNLTDKIPGFNPSVAEMAGSPGLIDMQRKFALMNPKNLNAELARNDANAQAVQDYYKTQIPNGGNAGNVRSNVNQALADSDAAIAEQAVQTAKNLPVVDQVGAGTKLTELATAEKAAARPKINAAYEHAYSLAPESTISATPILSKIEETLGVPLSKLRPETAPNTFNAIQRFLGGNGSKSPEELAYLSSILGGNIENSGAKATMTLREAADLRTAVNKDATLAARSTDPLAATRLRNIAGVKGTIDESIAASPIAQEAKDAYIAANNKYQTEFAPRFNEGTNQRVFKDTSANEPKILPDKFVSEYFKPDGQAGLTRAGQFGQLFGKNQEAKDVAKQGILDIYRQKVVNPNTGAIDQTAHNIFMRNYGRTLESYRLQGVDAVTDIKNVAQQASKVSDSLASIKSLSQSMKFETSDDLANAALSSPKIMGNTITRLTPENKSTFNSMLLDKSFESRTASGMRQFLETNKKTLSMTVPPEQLSAMQDIANALEMVERAPIRGNLASAGADMLKSATGISTATVFSQIRAVTGKRSSVEWAGINLAMPAINKLTQTSFANVMEQALHSKDSAVALRNYLMAETPDAANGLASKLLQTMKYSGKMLWAAKGPVTKQFIGPQMYRENLARSAPVIQATMADLLRQNQNPQTTLDPQEIARQLREGR